MIDVNEFAYNKSRWQDIFLHLKKEGSDVHSPGTKIGECTSKYVDNRRKKKHGY